MAEFQEVARQWKRMFIEAVAEGDKDGLGCVKHCKLAHNPVCGDLACAKDYDFDVAESVIMQWAAEHPEPVYETWFEYLLRIGVIPEDAPAGGEYQWIVESIKHKHISNDIAESLKLHPKEVQA